MIWPIARDARNPRHFGTISCLRGSLQGVIIEDTPLLKPTASRHQRTSIVAVRCDKPSHCTSPIGGRKDKEFNMKHLRCNPPPDSITRNYTIGGIDVGDDNCCDAPVGSRLVLCGGVLGRNYSGSRNATLEHLLDQTSSRTKPCGWAPSRPPREVARGGGNCLLSNQRSSASDASALVVVGLPCRCRRDVLLSFSSSSRSRIVAP